MNILISAQNIHKSYNTLSGNTEVIKGISYAFEENKIYSIVGRSGSGKSTFLHILGGLCRPSEGKVLFQGENLYMKSDEQMAIFRRRHMGFIFQQYNLLEEHNVLNNICMPAKLDHGNIDKKFLQEVVGLLGFEDKLKRYPSQLSGGEQQRVAIARAILAKPELVIADEPTGNLDPVISMEIMNILDKINRDLGTTILMVTHDHEIVENMKKRVLVLKDGRLIKDYKEGEYKNEVF